MRVRPAATLALFGLVGLPGVVLGQAGLLVPTRTGRPDARVLSLREMSIDVGIARGYARVNVRQVFENRTGDVQEGTYRFRLPPSAAIGDFAVWDDLVRIPGVILEKRRARAIYQELTTQRIDPGLLQQGEEDEGGHASVRGGRLLGQGRTRASLRHQAARDPVPAGGPFISGRGEFRLGLRPPDGEPPVAAHLAVRVAVADADATTGAGGLPLSADAAGLALAGRDVRLDRDLVVSLSPHGATPLRLSAFRNPDGVLPDGFALAPWERAFELPPERDGFFLLELTPQMEPAAPAARAVAKGHPPVTRRYPLRHLAQPPLRRAREILRRARAAPPFPDAARSLRPRDLRPDSGRGCSPQVLQLPRRSRPPSRPCAPGPWARGPTC